MTEIIYPFVLLFTWIACYWIGHHIAERASFKVFMSVVDQMKIDHPEINMKQVMERAYKRVRQNGF